MDSVAFLQQQIDELTLQISQLVSKREQLYRDRRFAMAQHQAELLRENNLTKNPDVLK